MTRFTKPAPSPSDSPAGGTAADSGTEAELSAEKQAPVQQDASAKPIAVVGIGASAGGLAACCELFRALPPDTGMGFVVVQHLASSHQSMLAEILARTTSMPVMEVNDEPRIKPNHIYVIPPGRNMVTRDGELSLSLRPPGVHHSIDLFFAALADSHAHLAIGVVLSGMGSDGTIGLQAIKAAGGITFAQDTSAAYNDMPHSAIETGCVDLVLSPQEIAHELGNIARGPYVSPQNEEPLKPSEKLDDILDIIQQALSVDFTQYKSNTLQRRISRRMALRKIPTLKEYKAFLKQTPEEVQALYQDVLISVTNFFRNPECFDALRAQVFPLLFANRSAKDPIRVWVIGCSTGEEAYSVAIALTEYGEEQAEQIPITVYATDLNNASIERARRGWYPKEIAHDVSAQRLRRFFYQSESGYCVSKALREMCIFARHNILTDPPFSRLDLVTCRNVLIYFDSALQRRVLPLLHYALKPSGFLFLGPSESLTQQRELFEVEDSKHKIYCKRMAPASMRADLPITVQARTPREQLRLKRTDVIRDPQAELQREAERVLISKYVPVGVLINRDADVLQFRGDTGLYLKPAPGKANHDLLKMTREGLLMPLRAALMRAQKTDVSLREENIQVRTNGGFHTISLNIIPVQLPGSSERCYWVMFEPERDKLLESAQAPRERDSAVISDADKVERLTQELDATRDYLQSVIRELESSNEELQSANEEVQSTNEELQSINEELQTSKEEIQSSNEELSTVNEELRTRNEELARASDDLNNLFGSVQMAIVMVWQDRRIRRFTPIAEKIFNFIPSDVGRSIGDIKLNINVPDLSKVLIEVISTVQPQEMEVQDHAGHWYLLRVRPYLTIENKIDGAIVALVDIDTLKRGQALQARQAHLLEQVHEAIFAWEPSGRIVYWNPSAEALYGYSSEEATNHSIRQLLRRDSSQGSLSILERKEYWSGECIHYTKDGRQIIVESTQVLAREGERYLVLETNRDITQRKQLEDSLRARVAELAAADKHKNEFLAMLAHELRNPLAPLLYAAQLLNQPDIDAQSSSRARALIERQAHNMAHMVTDLLDAARVARGQVQLRTEPVDLKALLDHSVSMVRPSCETSGHVLTLNLPEQPVPIHGDVTRLEQAFGNILANAIKYTPTGGLIHVALEVAPSKDKGVEHEAVITVRDNGIGIAKDLLPQIFDLFVQADRSLEHSKGGLGIGLSLVRTFISLHGGRVEASSEGLGRGCEFKLYLPLAVNTQVEPSSRAAPLRAMPTLRVLVVDDNSDVAESSALLLSGAGHQVRVALSGKDALKIAEQFQPVAVLLDIGMPDMNGFEVAQHMRKLPGLTDVCLIAVSGYDNAEIRAESHQIGFDAHLSKPFSISELNSVFIKHAIKKRPL